MKIVPGDTVRTADGKVLDISERTPDNYLTSVDRMGNARLFKPNGHYAGGDRGKNAVEVL